MPGAWPAKAGTSGTGWASPTAWWSQSSQTAYWTQTYTPSVFHCCGKHINLKRQENGGGGRGDNILSFKEKNKTKPKSQFLHC